MCLGTLLVKTGDVVIGVVTHRVNDSSIDGGCFYIAMSEEFGDGVEIGSYHECHCGIAVASCMEGDVFVDLCVLHPLPDSLFDGGCGRQGEYELVGTPLGRWEPSEGIFVELIGDVVLCFLHDDGEAVVIACLMDISPFEMSDVTQSKSCEAAEEEALLYLLVGTWGADEPCHFVCMKKILDDDGALWHFVRSHIGDGIGADGLFCSSFSEHAFEGAEVVIGADCRESFAISGTCMLEVLCKSLADFKINVLYLQSVDARSKEIDEVVVHVAAGAGITSPPVSLRTSVDVVFHILADSHACKGDVTIEARMSVGDFDDSSCFDGIGCGEHVFVDNLGIRCGLRHEVEVQELVHAYTIVVDVKIDGEAFIRELLKSYFDEFFSVRLFVCIHSLFGPKIRIKYCISVTE